MLIIQIILFTVLTIITLLFCKSSQKAEPREVSPEQDTYETPKEVKKEQERIQALLNSNDRDGSDTLIVHSLVKRYHTKRPDADK